MATMMSSSKLRKLSMPSKGSAKGKSQLETGDDEADDGDSDELDLSDLNSHDEPDDAHDGGDEGPMGDGEPDGDEGPADLSHVSDEDLMAELHSRGLGGSGKSHMDMASEDDSNY